MSTLKRLLGSLHTAVFDTSPDAALAFFIRHPDGVAWTVVDEKLTAKVGSITRTYPLNLLTIGQLAGQLVIDGFEVEGLSPEFASLSASVLIEGSGSTLNSNGDRLFGFRDLLHSLLGGYARELRAAKEQIGEALKQMVITQAEGEWLDLWGALYNTPRPAGMGEAAYQKLIPEEAFRLRVNARAIEKAVLDLTGQRITIEEPWGDMFRLDFSQLSSTYRFYDGSTVGYHLIQPISTNTIVWDGITDIIERNKAAGVIVLPPEERNRYWVNDPLAGLIWFQQTHMQSILVKTAKLPRLDDTLLLSAYELDKNYKVMITSTQMITSVPDELNGTISDGTRFDVQGWEAIGPHDQVILPYHSGFHGPTFVAMYPASSMSWLQKGGTWRGGETWREEYSWRIYTATASNFAAKLLPEHINGTIIYEATQGIDWTVPSSWNDWAWDYGTDASGAE